MILANRLVAAALLAAALMACQPDNAPCSGPVFTDRSSGQPLTLEGTYFLARVKVYNRGRQMTDDEHQAIDELASQMPFRLFHFDRNGRCQSIFYNRRTVAPFTLKGTDLRLQDSTYHYLNLASNGFTMVLRRRVNGNPVDLEHRVYRFDLKDDTDQFLRLAEAIFTRPARSETDAQIRQRLKQTLAFYALYFRAIHDNHIVIYKPGVVCLPIKFYFGAIKAIDFSPTDGWTQLYATPGDAATAYALLDSTLTSLRDFPHRRSHALSYAAVLDQLNQRL